MICFWPNQRSNCRTLNELDHAADRKSRDHEAGDGRARLAGFCQQHRDIREDAE